MTDRINQTGGQTRPQTDRESRRAGLRVSRRGCFTARRETQISYLRISSLFFLATKCAADARYSLAPKHVTVFDKSARKDGTFAREDFNYDPAGNVYISPGGKTLTTTGTSVNDGETLLIEQG
jgi:hypothetical protein